MRHVLFNGIEMKFNRRKESIMVKGSEGGLRVITEQDWGPELPVIEGLGWCREVVGAGMGCSLRSLYHLRLESLSRTVPLCHSDEAVYYVVDGSIEVLAGQASTNVVTGGMVHIAPGTRYTLSSVGSATVVGGPAPCDEQFGMVGAGPETGRGHEGLSFYHRDEPGLMVPFISADARLVVWYGAGAVSANMNYVVLEPGERNQEHVHAYSEDTIFILEGRGTAEDVTNGVRIPFGPGDAVTIPPGVWHAVSADLGERVVSVGGPCPADLDMLRAVGVDVDEIATRLARA
jgi:quercetin dioxygenase-like cupin family protein